MKFPRLPTAFLLACMFARAIADISLDPFPSELTLGNTYTVSWNATANYTYTIWLVLDTAEDGSNTYYNWAKVSSVAFGLELPTLRGSQPFTVPSNLSQESSYALWFDAFVIPFNGQSTVAMTDWFQVTNTSSNNPTSSSGGSTDSTSGASSDSSSSSDHHDSISGGVIAGIVIGCVVAIALVIGAVLIVMRRRRQAGVKSREAEARANRLAPVMQESFPGYEMHSRTPSAG